MGKLITYTVHLLHKNVSLSLFMLWNWRPRQNLYMQSLQCHMIAAITWADMAFTAYTHSQSVFTWLIDLSAYDTPLWWLPFSHSPSTPSRLPLCQNLDFLAAVTAKMAASDDRKSRLQNLPDHLGHHRCYIHVFYSMFQTQLKLFATTLPAIVFTVHHAINCYAG